MNAKLGRMTVQGIDESLLPQARTSSLSVSRFRQRRRATWRDGQTVGVRSALGTSSPLTLLELERADRTEHLSRLIDMRARQSGHGGAGVSTSEAESPRTA